MEHSTSAAPHDALFRSALTDLPTARDFLGLYIPEKLRPLCDLSTLQLEQGSFIDPELRTFHSDILWSLETTDGPGYIYALIEHQSSPDKHMAFRLIRYAFGAMKQHLDRGHDRLPLVIPILFYHGRTSPYPYSLNWLQEFARPDLACALYGNELPLVDVTVMPDDKIMSHRRSALLEFIQKHIRRRDLNELMEGLVLLLSREYTGQEQVATTITYLLRSGNVADASAFIRDLAERLPQHEGTMMTGAEQLEKIGLEKGLEQGLEQGRIEGEQLGRRKVAHALLTNGMDPATVMSLTGLNEDQLSARP